MILITGASGRVGRRTAELLASEGRPLRLMTRTPQRVPRLVHAEVVYGDFAKPASLDSAFASVTTALVVSGFAEPGKRARPRPTRRLSVAPGCLPRLEISFFPRSRPERGIPFGNQTLVHCTSKCVLLGHMSRTVRCRWSPSWTGGARTSRLRFP